MNQSANSILNALNAIITPATGITLDFLLSYQPRQTEMQHQLYGRAGLDNYALILPRTGEPAGLCGCTLARPTWATHPILTVSGIDSETIGLYHTLTAGLPQNDVFVPRIERIILRLAQGTEVLLKNRLTGIDYDMLVNKDESLDQFYTAYLGIIEKAKAEPRVTEANKEDYLDEMNDYVQTRFGYPCRLLRFINIEFDEMESTVFYRQRPDGKLQETNGLSVVISAVGLAGEFFEVEDERQTEEIIDRAERRRTQYETDCQLPTP